MPFLEFGILHTVSVDKASERLGYSFKKIPYFILVKN